MTQPPFDESQHPRDEGGKFAMKPSPESELDLGPVGPSTARQRLEQHGAAIRALRQAESDLDRQLSQVRTEAARHELAVAVTKADHDAYLPEGATHVRMELVGDRMGAGSSWLAPRAFLDADGRYLDDVSPQHYVALSRFTLSAHREPSDPDPLLGGLIVPVHANPDETMIDLQAVRDFSAGHDPSTHGEVVRG